MILYQELHFMHQDFLLLPNRNCRSKKVAKLDLCNEEIKVKIDGININAR